MLVKKASETELNRLPCSLCHPSVGDLDICKQIISVQ